MSDLDVVSQILKIIPDATFEFQQEKCIVAKITNKSNLFFGCMRNLSNSDKIEVLKLISCLKNIRHLDLRKNRLNKIIDFDLPELEHLDLASNYLSNVPVWIKNNNLKFLNLGVNNLINIPDWMSNFKELQVL